ncbi:MAG: hypothetical protein D6729_04235, partial [Deltaproteobacteria bacterium]
AEAAAAEARREREARRRAREEAEQSAARKALEAERARLREMVRAARGADDPGEEAEDRGEGGDRHEAEAKDTPPSKRRPEEVVDPDLDAEFESLSDEDF